MEHIYQITMICLTGAILAALLRKSSPDLALLLVLAVVIVVLLSLTKTLEEITGLLTQIMEAGGMTPGLFEPLLKTVAIALISRTGADLCRDAGAGAMAHVLETAGAFIAVLAALPLFEAVWEMLQMLL